MADVFTTTGRAHIAGLLSNVVAAPANYFGNVAVGTGGAVVGDTTLTGEVGTARITTASSRITTTLTNDTAQNMFTFTSGSSQTINGAAVFTASSAGTMIQKSDHAGIPLLSGDSIAYTFKAQMT